MTNENLAELREILGQATDEDRANLKQIINGGFGDSPEALCDQFQFLRRGFVGQLFDRRDYKQLVTDVADEIAIDWDALLRGRRWMELSASEIEDAVVVKSVEAIVENLPTESRRLLAEKISEEANDPNLATALLTGGVITLARLSGFQVYLLSTTALGALSGALGITLPFAIYTGLTAGLRFILGPIGLALTGVSILVGLNRSNWDRLIPGVIYVSYMRHKSQVT